jgi:NADH dehydrogenase
MPARAHRVVVVGGGFAGTACVQGLDRRHFEVTLVDQKSAFEFLPNIHELISGVKTAPAVQLPLRPLLESLGHRFRRARVQAIDTAKQQVLLERGRPLPYDSLVVAAGAADATYGIPGVTRNSLPFKSAADCERIRKRLASLAQRRAPAEVVIIGGGLSGVEALGEVLRRYRSPACGLAVTLVEARERLLPQQPGTLDGHLRDVCEPHAVTLLCGDPVQRVSPRSVALASGRSLRSDLTIWTGGPAPADWLAESGLAQPGEWAPVDTALRSTLCEGVYVAGDAAGLPEPVPRQAYHSLDMGACVARNLRREQRGSRAADYRPSAKPVLVSFGDLSAMLVAGRCALAGPALAVGKELVFEAVMAQLDARRGPSPVLAAIGRGELALRRLAWPTARSLTALQRQLSLKPLF